ncbi:SprT family zinc-dependent metalloprotease [Pedobacter sandarakinus]|uniref:hypothetical protein n=1 Tax=Pedobacter sandarakinus TaxID=353156 RepID=UPI0022464DAC|nr:hypothetical protein [Pedobacter sandarakinus]MCX2573809.1 hypothetical protein [Pedobacter sandarakinus]
MRNFYAQLKAYTLAFTLLVATSVIIYSCKKDRNPIKDESDTIAHLQAWYEVQIGENPITSAIFRKGSTSDAKIPTAAEQELKIDWANAKSYESKDRTIIEVPVLTAGIFMFDTEPLTKENNQIKKDKSITRLLISETNDYKEACFMTIISSADYLANTDAKPENNTYLKQQANFEGLIIYHNLNGDYVAGKKFGKMQNELDKQLSLSPVKDRKVSIAVPDNCREIYIYQIMGYNCVDVGSNFTYCESTYSNYVGSQTICGTGYQTDPWQGLPWGSGSGTTYVKKDIHNKTIDPCLTKIVDSLLKVKNITGKMDSILKKLNKDVSVQINVYDAETLSGNKPGQTSGGHWENGIFSTDITLNKNILLNASKEFIVCTIIHEVLHAYFRDKEGKAEAINEMDHNQMANNYVLPMAEYLRDLFNITLYDATAIVWEGLKETNAYKNSTTFDIGSGVNKISVTKSDLSFRGTEYYLRLDNVGKKPCN